MTHAEIKQKIEDILNEHGGDSTVSIAENRVLLDDYIKVAIPDAVTMLAVKGYRVNVAKSTSKNVSAAVPGFLSLIYAKDPSWTRAVTKVTELGSPEYVMAMNRFTEPGKNNPMCYMEDEDVLIFIPAITQVGTVEYNTSYNGTTLTAAPKEATAVCYMAAAIVLGLFGDDQGKQRLSDISTNMLQ